MRQLSSLVICSLLAVTASGCGSDSTTSPTTPSTTSTFVYTLVGTVPAAVDGVRRSNTHQFVLGSSSAVSLVLTSATEALVDGTTLTTVVMGIGLGSVANGVCVVPAGSTIQATYSADVQLTKTLPQVTGCVVVSDVTVQEGPVTYQIGLKF